jgi:hypothetical protein
MGYYHMKLIPPQPSFPFDRDEAEAEALSAADPVISASLGFRYQVSIPSLILRDTDN